ncbi:MAG: transcription elongation factor GreA [Candidatus Cloacimonetes bacterium]|nr:transcription elongation factor GreA [Candidatus Cloacimonadota bacterium]
MDLNYITIKGLIKLKERLQYLNTIERPEVIKQVVTAREMGDLSENAEYHAAKERQRHIDKEINHLRSRISRLKALDPAQIPKDAVRFGAIVSLKDLHNDELMHYQIVGIDEVGDPEDNIHPISIASPIGKGLLGKKPGDTVLIKVPAGEREFNIIEIK